MAGSVTEMRFSLSVVLISSDLPTITRKGAEPCDCKGACGGCAGSVVVCVPDGAWLGEVAAASGCCILSHNAGTTVATLNSNVPSKVLRTFIFRMLSLGGNLLVHQPASRKIETLPFTWSQNLRRGISPHP